ncbi:MAG: hypothetical protein H8E38_09945 [SAR324 cluster bacterium]|nr:hypothetical protein [SAR324 cluster bacterium]
MSTNTLEQLKRAQSNLHAERKPVAQIQDAFKQAKEITQFVNAALSKDNRWVLQSGEQESIISMLREINRTNKDLYDKCRSPEHFNREVDRFLQMKHQILRQSECIHLSLDQGFYDTEPLGFSAGKAIEVSLNRIRSIRDGHQQGSWSSLPIEAPVAETAKTEVEKLFLEAAPLAEKLLKNPNISTFDPPMTIEEVQSVYKYFQNVHRIQQLEEEALSTALAAKPTLESASPDEIMHRLSGFERNLKNVKMPTSNNIPQWGLDLYEISRTDMFLRMHLLRIPFEPVGFLKNHLKNLQEQKELVGTEKSITEFHDHVVKELEQLQYFIETFSSVSVTLQEVTSILQSLSISFGKIYNNASSQTITSNFLIKALALIKGLIEKGGNVAGSKSKKLLNLRQRLTELDLFDVPITEGMLYTLELLEQGKKEMSQYCEQIKSFITILSESKDWSSRKTYAFLQKSYDENASLTSAAMIFGSVTKTCLLLESSIGKVESMWCELEKLSKQLDDKSKLYEQTVSFLEKDPEYTEETLKHSTEQVKELNWILDEMLGQGAKEELRFVDELHAELSPVGVRVQAKKIKEATRMSEQSKAVNKTEETHITKKTEHKTKKRDRAQLMPARAKKSVYDPFQSYEMVALKEACRKMTSSQGKMIYHVLTNTHAFFTMLNKLERYYNPNENVEIELEQDLAKSLTTQDFLSNFARLKFLPSGYLNNNKAPLVYSKAEGMFRVPEGVEKHLKISENSIATPMEVYQRLIRVLLGLVDSKTLATIMPKQVLSIFEEDFLLQGIDRRSVRDALESV